MRLVAKTHTIWSDELPAMMVVHGPPVTQLHWSGFTRMPHAAPVSTIFLPSFHPCRWDNLRAPSTIQSMLQLVYANKGAADEVLVQRIVDATAQPGALDAFASIVLSPKSPLDFDAMVDLVSQQRVPVCMAYGGCACRHAQQLLHGRCHCPARGTCLLGCTSSACLLGGDHGLLSMAMNHHTKQRIGTWSAGKER